MSPDDSNEIYDLVDSDDRVIGQATRREIHAKGLLHRSAHVLVFNSAGLLFLQKRSLQKDESPGFWDTSAAGHLDAGEYYPEAAVRELNEELSITAELTEVLKISAGQDTHWEHIRVYRCTSDQTIVINLSEISEGRFWSLDEIREALTKNDPPFTSTFRLIHLRHLSIN
jgi:isopentenyldiphosphate isomerase